MVTPLSDAFESCVFDSQSVEMLEELLAACEELERIADELLKMALLELDLCAELLDCFSLELLSLTLDELLAACEELERISDELLKIASLELEEMFLLEELDGCIAERFCMFPERSNPERTCMASLKYVSELLASNADE